VRRSLVDDGAGGIEESTPIVLYASRKCRVSALNPDDIKLESQGFEPHRHKKVVMVYSPKVERMDVLQIPWGVPPNVIPPVELGDKFAPSYVIELPSTTQVTLTWDGTKYVSNDGNFIVIWSSSVWTFQKLSSPTLSVTFPGFTISQNIFKRPWDVEVGAGYRVVRATAPLKDYRIVWTKHQIDTIGRYHHTSLLIELQKADE
jgi:hypothetical protein